MLPATCKFDGIGSKTRKTLGACVLKVLIDNVFYDIRVFVVPDDYMVENLLIGGDFFGNRENE